MQQMARGQAALHEGQLPGQVVGILQRRVHAAHTEDRHQMRGIASEQHLAMQVGRQGHGAGAVQRHPDRLPRAVYAQHVELPLYGGEHRFFAHCLGFVLVGPELIVKAQHAIGLFVHQHGALGIGGRAEPAMAPGIQAAGVDANIDDDVAPGVALAFHAQVKQPAQRALSAIAGHHPVAVQAVIASRCGDAELGLVVALRNGLDPRLPADIDQPATLGRLHHQPFDTVL